MGIEWYFLLSVSIFLYPTLVISVVSVNVHPTLVISVETNEHLFMYLFLGHFVVFYEVPFSPELSLLICWNPFCSLESNLR